MRYKGLLEIQSVSHDDVEQEAPKDMGLGPFIYVEHPLDNQGPIEPVDSRRVIFPRIQKEDDDMRSLLH